MWQLYNLFTIVWSHSAIVPNNLIGSASLCGASDYCERYRMSLRRTISLQAIETITTPC